MSEDADRLIAAALRDHARVAAPAGLRSTLERRYLDRPKRHRWLGPAIAACAGAAAAVVLMLALRPTPASNEDVAAEATGDHLRMLVGRGLGVEASDMHQVKPWFAGKLDFVPPVTFLGDDDFPLRGGDVAIVLGHKAAQLVYTRRLHVISLLVFEHPGVGDGERTVHGFHELQWSRDGFAFALVSDVAFEDLRALRDRLR